MDESLYRFTEALASAAPTPGGGGAAAVMGALAASLGAMSARLSAPRKACAEFAEELGRMTEHCEALRLRFLEQIEADAAAFLPLAAAYKLPKETPGRAETLEKHALDACSAATEMLLLCAATEAQPIQEAAEHLVTEPLDDPLLQAADVALGDAHGIGHLFLRIFPPAGEPKAHQNDALLPRAQLGDRLTQHLPVRVVLHGAGDLVLIGAENVGQQQLIAVPVGVQRLVKTDLRPLGADLAQVHQDLVFNAAGGVGRKLDLLPAVKGVHSLDEPDRPDGDQILQVDAGVFKALGDIDHEPKIVLNQAPARLSVPCFQGGERRLLVLAGEGSGQSVAPTDVKN